MYCPKCGTENDDNAWKCVKCGNDLHPGAPQKAPPPPPSSQPLEKIPNYLVQAILCTIFGLPLVIPGLLGIPAIVFAAQVDGKMARGDIEGARNYSNLAKTFCWISFGLILLFIVFYGLMFIISFIFAATS